MSSTASFDKLELPNGIRNVGGLSLFKQGFPSLIGFNNQLGLTSAANGFNVSNKNAGFFLVIARVNVTAWATPATFGIVLTYTDNNGTTHTTETQTLIGSATPGAVTAATAVDTYSMVFNLINANPGTISIATAGTFTGSPVYDFTSMLFQLG